MYRQSKNGLYGEVGHILWPVINFWTTNYWEDVEWARDDLVWIRIKGADPRIFITFLKAAKQCMFPQFLSE